MYALASVVGCSMFHDVQPRRNDRGEIGINCHTHGPFYLSLSVDEAVAFVEKLNAAIQRAREMEAATETQP